MPSELFAAFVVLGLCPVGIVAAVVGIVRDRRLSREADSIAAELHLGTIEVDTGIQIEIEYLGETVVHPVTAVVQIIVPEEETHA